MFVLVKVWEHSKKLKKHSPAAGFFIAFLIISGVIQIFVLFLNLIKVNNLIPKRSKSKNAGSLQGRVKHRPSDSKTSRDND